jgi:hypothetical protein
MDNPMANQRPRVVRLRACALRASAAGLLALAAFVFALPKGWAVGVFDPLILCSEVHGTVLKDGKPVAGAELVQRVVWSDDVNEIPPQRTVTDGAGTFSFPTIQRKAGLLRLIPAQPIVQQTIKIHFEGREYIAWMHGKTSYDANTELEGRPIKLVCELTREADYEGRHYGICRAG